MTRRRALWLLGAASLVLGAVLVAIDGRMWDQGGPGIVGFELAWTEHHVDRILVEWGPDGRDAARLSLWLDFAYLAAYGAFWALAAAASRDVARRRGWRRFAAVGPTMVALPIVAAASDALEDVSLLLALGRHGLGVTPVLAGAFATVKFLAIGVAIAYVVLVIARRLHERTPRLFVAGAVAAVALFALALAVTAWTAERETRPAKADIGRILRLPGGDIQVREDGDPKRPAIVLVHGFGCSMRWWDLVTPALASELHVVRIDLLGHGGSEKPRHGYSMENQADIVAQAMQRLGVRRAAVVGHSMGGAVVTALAVRHRAMVSRVMVIGTPPDGHREGVSLPYGVVFWPVTGPLVHRLITDRLVRADLERGFKPEVDPPERVFHDIFGRTTWSSFNGSWDGIKDYWDERALPERLAAARVPLTVIFGTRENIAREAIRKYNAVPGARTVLMQGLGHTPQLEAPERTAPLLLAFGRG